MSLRMVGYTTLLWGLLNLASCGGSGGDDPNTALPAITVSDVVLTEQAVPVAIPFSLSAASDDTVLVDFRLLADTAEADLDYLPISGTLSFAPGETTQSITVTIIDDLLEEPDETIILELSRASGARLNQNRARITIQANDRYNLAALDEFNPHWGTIGAFTDAATCGDCHSGSDDNSGVLRLPKTSTGTDISPYAGWQHNPMAHSLNDPYFLATLEDEVQHVPTLAATIEDKCLVCHAPMAHNHAHSTGTDLSTDSSCTKIDGCYRIDTAHESMMAREGVSCTLCHQITDTNLGTSFSGAFNIDTSLLTIFGPYLNPLTNPMINNTQYSVAGAPYIQDSAICSTCHNLNTPTVDINTNVETGTEFVEQAPYTEWLNSNFNLGTSDDQQCQDCHMPVIDNYSTQIATRKNGSANLNWPERSDYSQHQFLGANNYLLELLKDNRDLLGILNSTSVEGFEQQISYNSSFLKTQTAAISLDSINYQQDQLDINVTITNKAGHKLPTSYPSRRVWLNLIVRDTNGNLLFESGTPDENGFLVVDTPHTSEQCLSIEKAPTYNALDCYSPHYDVITNSNEIPIYESVIADTNDHVTYILLYGDGYLKDNRIPPAGFSQSDPRYNPETAIIGSASNDADFNIINGVEGSGQDTVHYQLDWQGLTTGTVTIEANLYYQTIRPAFVVGKLNSGSSIDLFKWMYSTNKPTAELIVSTRQNIDLN